MPAMLPDSSGFRQVRLFKAGVRRVGSLCAVGGTTFILRNFNMTKLLRGAAFAALALAGLTVGAEASNSVSTVTVLLSDKGATATPAQGLSMGKPGMDMNMATFSVKALPQRIKAGTVTFKVTNMSSDTIHEMILSPVADPTKPLPFDQANSKVLEDTAGHLGEVSELDPHKTGALTVDLAPGTYVLYCNIPGHFDGGMWTTVTVF
jgi:uncharacterized cupredoxin-like copper-binding protein